MHVIFDLGHFCCLTPRKDGPNRVGTAGGEVYTVDFSEGESIDIEINPQGDIQTLIGFISNFNTDLDFTIFEMEKLRKRVRSVKNKDRYKKDLEQIMPMFAQFANIGPGHVEFVRTSSTSSDTPRR